MKDGKCPKCGSTNILTNARVEVLYVHQLERHGSSAFEPAVDNRPILTEDVIAYVCDDCGYVETYMGDKARNKLRKEVTTFHR